jgi:hypothetical protein
MTKTYQRLPVGTMSLNDLFLFIYGGEVICKDDSYPGRCDFKIGTAILRVLVRYIGKGKTTKSSAVTSFMDRKKEKIEFQPKRTPPLRHLLEARSTSFTVYNNYISVNIWVERDASSTISLAVFVDPSAIISSV